jgi:hypothetical protein
MPQNASPENPSPAPASRSRKATSTPKASWRKDDAPRCGLCGKKSKKLTRTTCCGNWICDDEDKYVLFSYARNSCHRNHSRYTLCGYHHSEGHKGDWQTCPKCREIEAEMYVWYGTNEYNFVKLENPPAYEPTHCTKCGTVIVLSEGGYSECPDGIFCPECTWKKYSSPQPR